MGARRKAPEAADGVVYVPPEYRRNFPPGYGPDEKPWPGPLSMQMVIAFRRERVAWLAARGLGGSQATREELGRRWEAFRRSEAIDRRNT